LRSFTFSKADRLLKRHEFLRLSASGKRVQNRYFIANFGQGRAQRSRLGITVTKKVGNAVARNRIKRCVREYFRLNRHRLRGNWDINVIAKKSAAGLPSSLAFSSLENLFDSISRCAPSNEI
jgi:ribonuclease P protein component